MVSRNVSAKSNVGMFMVFPHGMHAQRFSVLITSNGCGHIVWVTCLLRFCLLLELTRAYLPIVLQQIKLSGINLEGPLISVS